MKIIRKQDEDEKILIPEVRFGSDDGEDVDWRKMDDDEFFDADDDELMDETPQDVIDVLGFDPLELFDKDGK